MFGREDELVRFLLVIGLATTFLSAFLTWAAARRYGRRNALVIPILALVAVAVLMWRAMGMDSLDAMSATATAVVFAGPAVAGGLLGLVLSAWPRR